jgi:hypothetical protein
MPADPLSAFFAAAPRTVQSERQVLASSYPPARARDFTSIPRGGFRHGESPEQAAAGLVGFVFAEVIEHDLSPEERKLISLQLQELHNQGKVLTGETTPLVHIIEWMLRISD